jgi:site-specific DNA-methyltransferase (adenine-specific)
MRPNEWDSFLADVKERGVRVPLEVQAGTSTILDGRSRWLAAQEAGLESVQVMDADLNGDDPIVYMLRAAGIRRHFTDDQRAMLAEKVRARLAKLNKEKQNEQGPRGKEGGRGKKKTPADDASAGDLPKRDRSENARIQAAKSQNVSERKAKNAQRVKKKRPDLAKKVLDGDMSLAQAAREVDRDEKRKELDKKAAEAERVAATATGRAWQVIQGDCGDELAKVKGANLIFADPPYNIGIDYGQGTAADRLPDRDYFDWCRGWVTACAQALAGDGTLWVLINDEHADEFGMMLRATGLTRRAWVKWYETFGVNCANNFNRCSRHLFYCVKDPEKFTFNAEAVNRPSDRQAKYNDKRADPGGKLWDDVWQIPRLVGNDKERIPDFPTQLPLDLLRPIVGCCSNPGDLVVDPFSGSATTGAAAIESGRRYVGIEKSERFAELSRKRLLAHGK